MLYSIVIIKSGEHVTHIGHIASIKSAQIKFCQASGAIEHRFCTAVHLDVASNNNSLDIARIAIPWPIRTVDSTVKLSAVSSFRRLDHQRSIRILGPLDGIAQIARKTHLRRGRHNAAASRRIASRRRGVAGGLAALDVPVVAVAVGEGLAAVVGQPDPEGELGVLVGIVDAFADLCNFQATGTGGVCELEAVGADGGRQAVCVTGDNDDDLFSVGVVVDGAVAAPHLADSVDMSAHVLHRVGDGGKLDEAAVAVADRLQHLGAFLQLEAERSCRCGRAVQRLGADEGHGGGAGLVVIGELRLGSLQRRNVAGDILLADQHPAGLRLLPDLIGSACGDAGDGGLLAALELQVKAAVVEDGGVIHRCKHSGEGQDFADSACGKGRLILVVHFAVAVSVPAEEVVFVEVEAVGGEGEFHVRIVVEGRHAAARALGGDELHGVAYRLPDPCAGKGGVVVVFELRRSPRGVWLSLTYPQAGVVVIGGRGGEGSRRILALKAEVGAQDDAGQAGAGGEHAVRAGATACIKSAHIQFGQAAAAQEHIAHVGDTACIKSAQIQAGQAAAVGEHTAHVGDTACIKSAQIHAGQAGAAEEHVRRAVCDLYTVFHNCPRYFSYVILIWPVRVNGLPLERTAHAIGRLNDQRAVLIDRPLHRITQIATGVKIVQLRRGRHNAASRRIASRRRGVRSGLSVGVILHLLLGVVHGGVLVNVLADELDMEGELLICIRLDVRPGGVLGDGERTVLQTVGEHGQSGLALVLFVAGDGGDDLAGAAADGADLAAGNAAGAGAAGAGLGLGQGVDVDVDLVEGEGAVAVIDDLDLVAHGLGAVDDGLVIAGHLTGDIEEGLGVAVLGEGVVLSEGDGCPDDLALGVVLGLQGIAVCVQNGVVVLVHQLEGELSVLQIPAAQGLPRTEGKGALGLVGVGEGNGGHGIAGIVQQLVLTFEIVGFAGHGAVAVVVGRDLNGNLTVVVGVARLTPVDLGDFIGVRHAVVRLGVADGAEECCSLGVHGGSTDDGIVLLHLEAELVALDGPAALQGLVHLKVKGAGSMILVDKLGLGGGIGVDGAGGAAGRDKGEAGGSLLGHSVPDAGGDVLQGQALAALEGEFAAIAQLAGAEFVSVTVVDGICIAVNDIHALAVRQSQREGELRIGRLVCHIPHFLGDDQVAVGIVTVGDGVGVLVSGGDVVLCGNLLHGVDDVFAVAALVQVSKGTLPLSLIVSTEHQRLAGEHAVCQQAHGDGGRTGQAAILLVARPQLGDRHFGLEQVVVVDYGDLVAFPFDTGFVMLHRIFREGIGDVFTVFIVGLQVLELAGPAVLLVQGQRQRIAVGVLHLFPVGGQADGDGVCAQAVVIVLIVPDLGHGKAAGDEAYLGVIVMNEGVPSCVTVRGGQIDVVISVAVLGGVIAAVGQILLHIRTGGRLHLQVGHENLAGIQLKVISVGILGGVNGNGRDLGELCGRGGSPDTGI